MFDAIQVLNRAMEREAYILGYFGEEGKIALEQASARGFTLPSKGEVLADTVEWIPEVVEAMRAPREITSKGEYSDNQEPF